MGFMVKMIVHCHHAAHSSLFWEVNETHHPVTALI